MIYLFDDGNGACIVFDGSFLTEEEKKYAVKIETLPEPEVIEGKEHFLRCNHETKKVWYDYVDIDINSLL